MTMVALPSLAELFASRVLDWTPPDAKSDARVIFAPASQDAEFARRCGPLLSPSEVAKAESFLTAEGRAHFKQRRAFRRYCASLAQASTEAPAQVQFHERDTGQPYLRHVSHLSFSFASCKQGYLGAWSATHNVGVDIEDRARGSELVEIAQGYFSVRESLAVVSAPDARTFLSLWALKEAALKSIGEGIPFGLTAFEFELRPSLSLVSAPLAHGGVESFRPYLIGGESQAAALVIAKRA